LKTQTLDTSGLKCPLPVLRARKALQGLAVGDILEITATDPAAASDFPAFCAATGHRLIEQRQDGSVWLFRIECAAR